MAPAWSATPPPLASWIFWNVLIMLMTVPNRPTMVATLAMARMGGSRKLRSGAISSSMALAMARRTAASPCLYDSSPAT